MTNTACVSLDPVNVRQCLFELSHASGADLRTAYGYRSELRQTLEVF